ncbi:MAG: toll/interleukin-1 receptor domain-containing protein [Erysipelotrichales bacterium]|nr:toll/interleukin-1 receptor domain-containing protein [Erysipelotrichales bacterium]
MQCYNCKSNKLKYCKEKDAYICLDCGYEYPKQYFFISHSHLDIEKVRIIRNIIEETFFYEPILFFLKCLSEDDEITDLVQREIFERIWFVYCKSDNAEKSKYVQEERKYIDYLTKNGKVKKILNVELDKFEIWDDNCYEYIRKQISHEIKKTKIFLSYSYRDNDIALMLYNWFTNRGYSVWNANDILDGDNFSESIYKTIQKYINNDGLFLPILTENSVKNSFVMAEIRYALEKNATIIAINIKGSCEIQIPIDHILQFTLDLDNIEISLNNLVDMINKL